MGQLQLTDTNMIKQSERLFTVRPRSVAMNTQGGDRGSRARLRILTTDPTRSRNRLSNGFVSKDHQDYIVNRLVTDQPGMGYSDFLLTNVSVTYSEKVQITQTFGDTDVVYYFGKAPIIFNLAGLLIDDVDNQWYTMFLEAYANILRGTELARNYELVELTLPNIIAIGTVMNFAPSQDSARDTDIPFTFQFLAKEVVPLPVQLPGNSPANAGNLIDFGKVASFTGIAELNKQKAALTQTLNTGASAISNPFSLITGGGSGATLPTFGNDNLGSFTTTINAFRSTLFSPVYGVLTTITKVVKATTGDISSIISSFTNPVNTILRDIRGIADQATAVVKLVENSVNQIVNIPLRTLTSVRDTITALKNTKGVISRAPETIAESIKRLFHVGILNGGAAFLTRNGTSNSKLSLLNSGKPYTPSSGARL